MIKRTGILCLCLALLLSLAGCGQGEQEAAEMPSVPASRLAAAAASVTEEPAAEELSVLDSGDGSELPFYAENIYGLAGGSWEDGAVRRGTGVHAYEIAVFRFNDKDAAETGEDLFRGYLRDRAGDFAGYAPEQAAMVENAAVLRRGTWLGLFICPDPDAAGDLFLSVLETGELPAPTAAPTAAPSATPSPAPPSTPSPTPGQITFELSWMSPPRRISLLCINWGQIEGAHDLQYPDRIRYEAPGREDMSLYDTGPILRAWESGDVSGLSAADLEIYDAARTLLGELLTDGMTGLQKEAAVYAWMVQNINYDWTHTDVTLDTPRESYGPCGGLIDHTAVCLGFASTFQLLMDLSGVECITIIGASQSSQEEHAWNMVRLNGQWYCVDATWDSNYRENGATDGWEWYFFNVTSDYMARTNHQWDYSAVPEAAAQDHGIV